MPQEKSERNALQEQISALVSVGARMSVDNFINASGEEECVEEFDEEHALFGDMEDGLEGSSERRWNRIGCNARRGDTSSAPARAIEGSCCCQENFDKSLLRRL